MTVTDLTIIGGGPVGLFAAFYAGLRGMSVRIIDSLPTLGGQLTALYPEKYVYDMPGFPKILAKDLAAEMAKQGTQFSPEVVLDEIASSLAITEHGYIINDKFETRTIIISAGAGAFSPTKIGVPMEEEFHGRGLHYGVRESALYAGKDVTIIGGGDSAFDWSLHLLPIAKSVTLVHRRDEFRAHEDSVKQVLNSSVKLKLWNQVTELHGIEKIEAVTLTHGQTKETERHETDAVIVNIGFKSTLGPLKEWGLVIEKNQIKVDHLFETNLPNIFAVGDVCTFEGKIKLIATGVGEAATAVCVAKTRLDSTAKLFPGHSSDLDL
ncbi:MAG: NAD(P)/FAD-dependent oxidoreductase [Fimbriimonadaceae bacterium]